MLKTSMSLTTDKIKELRNVQNKAGLKRGRSFSIEFFIMKCLRKAYMNRKESILERNHCRRYNPNGLSAIIPVRLNAAEYNTYHLWASMTRMSLSFLAYLALEEYLEEVLSECLGDQLRPAPERFFINYFAEIKADGLSCSVKESILLFTSIQDLISIPI